MKKIIYLLLITVSFCVIVSVAFFSLSPTIATANFCTKNSAKPPDLNAQFLEYIDSYPEKLLVKNIYTGEFSPNGSWREWDNKYDIFGSPQAQEISVNPKHFSSTALYVLQSPSYDQTQKMVSILLMQHLPIQNYLCLMDIVNTEFENKRLDKVVASQAIYPDFNLHGTSTNYWWHPSWKNRFHKNAKELFGNEPLPNMLDQWLSH